VTIDEPSTPEASAEAAGLALGGVGKIEEVDGEKVVRFSLPKAFQGHNFAADFYQNRDAATPEGPFLIDFVLCSEFVIHERDLPMTKLESGHSYLKLGKSLSKVARVVLIYSHPPDSGEPKEGFLTPIVEGGMIRRLRVELPETSLDTAVRVSSQIVHSVLDTISLRREVPVQIRHIEVHKEVGQDRFLRRYLTFSYSPVEIEEEDITLATSIPKPLAPALRLFREAINSSKPHYRLLCLYRVREVLDRVRNANTQALIQKGIQPRRPVRKVPDNDLTRAFFPGLIGKRFAAFLDYVRENYRIPVAHFELDEYERMILDPADVRVDHRVDYTNAVLIQIVKRMISDEIDLMKRHSL
jgi:hypothetical protein